MLPILNVRFVAGMAQSFWARLQFLFKLPFKRHDSVQVSCGHSPSLAHSFSNIFLASLTLSPCRSPTIVTLLGVINMEVFVRAENVFSNSSLSFFLAKADNPELVDALTKYHREGVTNNVKISQRLLAEYNISIS